MVGTGTAAVELIANTQTLHVRVVIPTAKTNGGVQVEVHLAGRLLHGWIALEVAPRLARSLRRVDRLHMIASDRKYPYACTGIF